MQFLGDADDVCPISFVPVRELAHPVGFDAHRAFECDSVTEWITQHRPTNPVTTLPVVGGPRVVDVLFPLVVEGNDAHVGATRIKLSDAGRVLLLDKKERLRRRRGPPRQAGRREGPGRRGRAGREGTCPSVQIHICASAVAHTCAPPRAPRGPGP